jgi:hypothetical protein
MGKSRVDVSVNGRSTAAAGGSPVSVASGALFATPMNGAGAPVPDAEWTLTGGAAGGTAHVFYAEGHRSLRAPLILADGFNYGPSDLPGLYQHLDAAAGDGFLSRLRARGRDVVLLGFDQRHASVLDNSEVATRCVRKAIAERDGDGPLAVGGVSMGGMITRHALARMETEGVDHETETYFSLDTPHNGAWIPLILQQLAYFFEALPAADPNAPKQAELVRSAAAQQLLWAWVPDSKFSGEVATASPLRTQFLAELSRVGQFPRRPRLIGVANGSGGGTGRPLPAGEVAFDWSALLDSVNATARFQGEGRGQSLGGMKFFGETRTVTTTDVPALDGAPGGTLASFGLVAAALGVKIDEDYRSSCFVPTISATAQDFDPATWDLDPRTAVDDRPDNSRLDDFRCDPDNSEHGTVTAGLAEFLLDRLAAR